MLIYIALARIPWISLSLTTLGIAGTNINQIKQALDSAEFHQFLLSDTGLIAGAILILVFGSYAIHRIYQRGDNRHWMEHETMRLVVGKVGSEIERKKSSNNVSAGRQFLIFINGYASLLKPNKLRGIAPIERSLLALGPAFQGGEVMAGGAFITLCVLIGVALMQWHLFQINPSAPKWAAAAYCVVPIFGYVQQIINSIYRTRPEQALVRLAPIAPSAHTFNKTLYPVLLKRFLLIWAALSIDGAISFVLLDGSTENVLQVLSVCTVYLLLAPCLVQDYAAMKPPESSSMIVGAILAMHAVILIFMAVHYLVYPAPWPILGLFSISIAIVMVVRRLRKIEPVFAAFPAGRLA